jgi:hypothetical protein
VYCIQNISFVRPPGTGVTETEIGVLAPNVIVSPFFFRRALLIKSSERGGGEGNLLEFFFKQKNIHLIITINVIFTNKLIFFQHLEPSDIHITDIFG